MSRDFTRCRTLWSWGMVAAHFRTRLERAWLAHQPLANSTPWTRHSIITPPSLHTAIDPAPIDQCRLQHRPIRCKQIPLAPAPGNPRHQSFMTELSTSPNGTHWVQQASLLWHPVRIIITYNTSSKYSYWAPQNSNIWIMHSPCTSHQVFQGATNKNMAPCLLKQLDSQT